MGDPKSSGPLGFKVIGVFKLVTAVLFVAAGAGIFRLLNKDIDASLEHWVYLIRLDPENWLIHSAIARVSGLDQGKLKLIGVGTFFYALLYVIEGVGLILEKRWASYLTVIATGSLIPIECYEVLKKPSAVRIAVLLLNVGIVIYLIVKVWQEHRSPSEHKAGGVAVSRG